MRAPQTPQDIHEQRIPPGQARQRPRLCGARVAALARQRQHVLPPVVRELHDDECWARRHHQAIVASVGRERPSSPTAERLLYGAARAISNVAFCG